MFRVHAATTLLTLFVLCLLGTSGVGQAAVWGVPSSTDWATSSATEEKSNTSLTVYGSFIAYENATEEGINSPLTMTYQQACDAGICTNCINGHHMTCSGFQKVISSSTKIIEHLNIDYFKVSRIGYGVDSRRYYYDCQQYMKDLKVNNVILLPEYQPYTSCSVSGYCDGDCGSTYGQLTITGAEGIKTSVLGTAGLTLGFTNARRKAGCYDDSCSSGSDCYTYSAYYYSGSSTGCDTEKMVDAQIDYRLIKPHENGQYTVVKDFGRTVKFTELFVDTTYPYDKTVTSINVDVWVDDDKNFNPTPDFTASLNNGGNTFQTEIAGLPSKRYMRLVFRFNADVKKIKSPQLKALTVSYVADDVAPVTAVAPDGGTFAEDKSFTTSCIDTGSGDVAGCNLSYYLATSLASCSPPARGLWTFDNITGSTMVQEPFNDIDGLKSGSVTFETTKDGRNNVSCFSGNPGDIKIADNPVSGDTKNPFLNGFNNDQFSMGFWVRPENLKQSEKVYLVSKWNDATQGDYQVILLPQTEGNKIKFVVRGKDASQSLVTEELVSDLSIKDDVWTFVVVTFDAGDMAIYINGTESGSKAGNVIKLTPETYTNDDLYLGSIHDGAGINVLDGCLDEVRVYNSVLSPEVVGRQYNSDGASELWWLGPNGLASCSAGNVCTWNVCAYSKDNNDNIETATVKQTYTINKGTVSCSVEVNPQVGKNFTVNVSTSEVGVSSMKIIWGSTSAMTDSQYVTCTHTSPPFSGAYECSGLSNASLFLACSATGTSGAVSNGTAKPVAVDVIDPSCTVRRTGNNVTCECSDPGSSIKSIECAIKDGTNYLSLSTQGCTLSSLACNGTTCNVTAACTSLADQVLFVRGTDKVSNLAAWKNSTETCTDDDGDDYCKEDDDCNDADAEINPDGIEVCDGVDNDCDGQIDEDWKAAPWNLTAVCGTGACSGTMVCNADGNGTVCNVPTTVGVEICDDDIDNDCDGTVDEEVDSAGNSACSCKNGTSRLCGSKLGICKEGNQTCSNNAWSVCVGQIAPQTEICKDELDNDCDGQVDEADCACEAGDTKPCGSNIGACEEGYRVCVNGEWGDECKGAVLPGTEFCDDNIDNDCDGDTDESSCTYKQDIGKICSNKQLDDGEEGVDCGGICDTACSTGVELWVIVAAVSIIVVIMLGLVVALNRGGAPAVPAQPPAF